MSNAVFAGEAVRIWLSPEGIAALAGIFDEPSFQANVAGSDELGVWIDFGDQSAMLLKWQYLATAVVALSPPQSSESSGKKIGFSN
jgi:hypothetical protein